MGFFGESCQRCGDFVDAGADVGGGGSGIAAVVAVSGVGTGDGVAEVAFDLGQGRVS
jgi:hypothetical protein